MTLAKFLAAAGLVVALCAAASPPASPKPSAFDPGLWKADYERLKLGLAQGYANLDWQVEKRGVNLKRADQQIGAMLDKAGSDVEAVLIFAKLLEAFNDPHLTLEPGPAPDGARALPMMSQVTVPAGGCADTTGERGATRLPYPSAKNYVPLAGQTFPTGMLGTTGYIRVGSFDETNYEAVCDIKALKGDPRARRLALRAMLNKAMEQRIAMLKARGMTRLVIDLSRNGGGSEWSSEMAAMFARGPMTRTAPRLARPSCDRSGIWRGEKVCSIYGPAEIETIQGTGIWTGPLAILIDHRTASAAEEFAVWLKDNGRANIVGERSAGAGCGYVDGGGAIQFRAANIHMMVPNCSRFRRDGTNEIEGITPDIAANWAVLAPDQAIETIERAF